MHTWSSQTRCRDFPLLLSMIWHVECSLYTAKFLILNSDIEVCPLGDFFDVCLNRWDWRIDLECILDRWRMVERYQTEKHVVCMLNSVVCRVNQDSAWNKVDDWHTSQEVQRFQCHIPLPKTKLVLVDFQKKTGRTIMCVQTMANRYKTFRQCVNDLSNLQNKTLLHTKHISMICACYNHARTAFL